jgi:hypothetical protein
MSKYVWNFFLSSSTCAKGYMIIYSTKSLDQSLICICFLPINVRLLCTTLKRQFRLYIPFLGIARPQPQFPHSCVCERFIYSHIFPPAEMADPLREYIIRSQTHECGNWD